MKYDGDFEDFMSGYKDYMFDEVSECDDDWDDFEGGGLPHEFGDADPNWAYEQRGLIKGYDYD